MAVLHSFGKYPSVKDLLTINFKVGSMLSMESFNNQVGMGSREQLLLGALARSFIISQSDKGTNLQNETSCTMSGIEVVDTLSSLLPSS